MNWKSFFKKLSHWKKKKKARECNKEAESLPPCTSPSPAEIYLGIFTEEEDNESNLVVQEIAILPTEPSSWLESSNVSCNSRNQTMCSRNWPPSQQNAQKRNRIRTNPWLSSQTNKKPRLNSPLSDNEPDPQKIDEIHPTDCLSNTSCHHQEEHVISERVNQPENQALKQRRKKKRRRHKLPEFKQSQESLVFTPQNWKIIHENDKINIVRAHDKGPSLVLVANSQVQADYPPFDVNGVPACLSTTYANTTFQTLNEVDTSINYINQLHQDLKQKIARLQQGRWVFEEQLGYIHSLQQRQAMIQDDLQREIEDLRRERFGVELSDWEIDAVEAF